VSDNESGGGGMPGLAKSDPTEPGRWSRFLKPIKEYKELITVIVFFVGGALWIFGYFATKHQVKQLQCLLNANISFLQGRLDSGSLSQLLVENLKESTLLDTKGTLTSDETLKRNQLKAAATEIIQKIADADGATAKALSQLKAGDCVVD
jgi:hypothetical protein